MGPPAELDDVELGVDELEDTDDRVLVLDVDDVVMVEAEVNVTDLLVAVVFVTLAVVEDSMLVNL